MSSMTPRAPARPRIGIVGCGAVAKLHLMVLDATGVAELGAFCDLDRARAEELARERGIAHAVADYRELVGLVDAAIVALPHHLHAEVASHLLEQGVHVLVEKPMAMTAAECDRMIAASKAGGTTLAVGVARRFYDATRYVKRMLDERWLGEVVEFSAEEGTVYSWPVASDFMFRRSAGGGVLLDTGAHLLDRLVHWLGDPKSVTYHDDARGGVEADCRLELELENGARGVVVLSRIRDLKNRWLIRCERGTIEIETKFHPEVRIHQPRQPFAFEGRVWRPDGRDEDPLDCFARSFRDFVECARTGREPVGSGTEGRRSVALMEACLAARRPLEPAWAAL
jgi:predicted dehydrogenase